LVGLVAGLLNESKFGLADAKRFVVAQCTGWSGFAVEVDWVASRFELSHGQQVVVEDQFGVLA
jgi:hypothetical protein